MKLTRLFLASIGSAALFAVSTARAQTGTITQWTFENLTTGANSSPAPSTGTGTATALGMATYSTPGVGTSAPDVDQGASGDTGANGVADTTKTWRVRATGAGNGWSSSAPIGTQGAEFAVSTSGETTGALQVNFDWYTTTQGEANLMLQYTLNDTATTPTWIDVPLSLNGSDTGAKVLTNSTNASIVTGSYVNDTTANTSGGQDWFTNLTASITDPNALNDPNFAFEMVNAATGTACVSTQGTALNNSSGNWRFDNVTVSDVASAPEPTSWILGLGAASLLLVLGLRRRVASRR